jgi:hypothetical protein
LWTGTRAITWALPVELRDTQLNCMTSAGHSPP